MKFPEFFRSKNKEELKTQVKTTEDILETKILPPDTSFDASLDLSKIKDEYKTRYAAYLDTLRAEKQENLNTKEIQHAKEWIKALNNLDVYIKDHESKDNPLLRAKQFLVFKKIRDFLEKGKRKGYIKLPTGSGKTILFLKIAEALDMKTFVASPTETILGQNAGETGVHTGSEYGKYYTREKDLSKKVTHIIYNSLVNGVKDGKINPDDVPVLILDEAHRSLGPKRSQTINKFEGLQLAFTATPEFSEEKKLADTYEEIFSMKIAEAINEGMNCQTQVLFQNTEVDLSSVDISNGEYDKKQIEKAVNVYGRNMSALKLYKEKFSHLKVFCNCSGVDHAQDVAKLFNENGIPSACITGTTSPDERTRILTEYKEGTIRVLTNARVLIEGFDEPTCAVTFNLHPTLSLVDAEQRARSGRLDKNDPDKWNYVVEFRDKNAKKNPVLYSEILNADRLWDLTKQENNIRNTDGSTREPKPPINFDDFSVDGLKIITDTQTIMEVTKRNLAFRENKDDDIPDGWENVVDLSEKLEAPYFLIEEVAERSHNEHPEWFKEFYKKGKKVNFYSKELVEILTEKLLIPLDWEQSSEILRDLCEPVVEKIDSYRKTNSEWFRNFERTNKEYFSPELVNKLKHDNKEELSNIVEYKVGWEDTSTLFKELKTPYVLIEEVAERYRHEHPDWFEKQRLGSYISEYYSPKLVEILLEKLKIPEGWLTRVAAQISSSKSITEKLDLYRKTNPEWFRNFERQGREYLSPELIEKFQKEKIKSEEKENLTSANVLAREFKVGDLLVKEVAEIYRHEHPDWFEIKEKSGRDIEYYVPELVSVLREKFRILPGWELSSHVLITLPVLVKEKIALYRKTKPDWFRNFERVKNTYFSPELIQILQEEKRQFKKNKRKNSELNPVNLLKKSLAIKKDLIKEELVDIRKVSERKEGWDIPDNLARKFEVDVKLIKQIAEKYRPENSQYFERQKRYGATLEHYSPELIKKIEKDLENI